MIGTLGLLIRLGLYVLAGWLANAGWAEWQEAEGTVTVNLDAMAEWIGAGLTFAGTFIASRWVKARGGKT